MGFKERCLRLYLCFFGNPSHTGAPLLPKDSARKDLPPGQGTLPAAPNGCNIFCRSCELTLPGAVEDGVRPDVCARSWDGATCPSNGHEVGILQLVDALANQVV